MEGDGRFWRNWRGLNEEGRVEQERVIRPNLDFFSHLWSPDLSITPQRQMWHGSQGELFWRKRMIGEGREHLEGSCRANVNKILWCLHTTMSQWSLLFCMQTKEAYRKKNIWTTSLQCQKYVQPCQKNCCPRTQLLSRFSHLHASWIWCLSYFKPVASDISFFLKSVNIKWQVKSHIDSITWLKFEAGAQCWPEVPRFPREGWMTAFCCVCV